MNEFYGDMTRNEVCRAYANSKGSQYGFTDKDYVWSDYFEAAQKMHDHDLWWWCVDEFGYSSQ